MALLFAIVLLYGAFLAVLYFGQARFVYFPTSDYVATPHDLGLQYEAVGFKSGKSAVLSAWFVPADHPRGVILYCHGNGGNISMRVDTIGLFHQLGMSVLIFDYRGYGRSGGRPSESGTYEDAEAAWRYLTEVRHIPASQIVLFGESLGGAVAAWLAQDRSPAGLILCSAFTSIRDMARRVYPFVPAKLLVRYDYDTVAYLRRVHCPVLVIHSRDDEVVPFAQGQRLFAAASAPKEWLEIRGDHNSGFVSSGDVCTGGVADFLAKYLPERAETVVN